MIVGGHGGGPVGAYLFAMLVGEPVGPGPFTGYYLAVLIPAALLMFACVSRRHLGLKLAQVGGSLLYLGWWGWLLTHSEYAILTVVSSFLFLGLTAFSLQEAFYFEPRTFRVEPALRFSIAILLIDRFSRAGIQLVQVYRRSQIDGLQKAIVSEFPLLGTIVSCTLILLLVAFIWGAWHRNRWAPWPGMMAIGYLLLAGTWSLLQMVLSDKDYGIGMRSISFFSSAPRLLCLMTAFASLLFHAWNRPAKTKLETSARNP